MGRDLFPVIAAMVAWGDRWTAGEAGPPLLFIHRACGKAAAITGTCDQCGERLGIDDIDFVPGPGG